MAMRDRFTAFVNPLDEAVDLSEQVEQVEHAAGPARDERISLGALTSTTGQMALMLRNGTSLVECLEALAEQSNDERLFAVLMRLQQELKGGSTFSSALAQHPRVFDSFYVSTVRAGEGAGNLADVFSRLEIHLQKQADMRHSMITALIYPAVVSLLSFSAVIFIMTYVLPRFITIFERNRVELPAPTRLLMGVSGFLTDYWYIALVLIIGAPALLYFYLRAAVRTAAVDDLILRLPLIGPLSVGLQTGYLFRSLGTQLASGVPLLESLDVARDACPNIRFKGLVNDVVRAVTQGEEVSAAFRRSSFLNPAVKQMIATGDQTGNLASTFIALADHLDKTNEKQIKRLSAVFEPLLLVLMGAMIGFIAVATLFPLFKLTAAVHG